MITIKSGRIFFSIAVIYSYTLQLARKLLIALLLIAYNSVVCHLQSQGCVVCTETRIHFPAYKQLVDYKEIFTQLDFFFLYWITIDDCKFKARVINS